MMQDGREVRVVIIGGGVTGTGVARDLAVRGIPALLLEQGDLCAGASSRFHGLLHSGARYAVGDPEAARECIEENRILRRIAPACIEECEGWFVRTPEDDPAFEARWIDACRNCGIEALPVDLGEARRLEPALTLETRAVYRVPDSAVDGFRMVRHNAMAALRLGGQICTYTRVTGIEVAQGAVCGVWAEGFGTGAKRFIPCEYIINAAGAWAGATAALAGQDVHVSPDRGLLLAFNHRFAGRVVNRLRKATDGDIFVPHGTVVIFGTTSTPVRRPDDTGTDPAEALRLLNEGETLFPRLRDYRILRAFAGTRPLYSPDPAAGRAATRNFVILDHEEDGLKGMATVTGGKFTSFRLMAEKVCDLAARRLGVDAPCRTALEPLLPAPSAELMRRAGKVFPAGGAVIAAARLGSGLEKAVDAAEKSPWKRLLLCECEMVTPAEFEVAASEALALSACASGDLYPPQIRSTSSGQSPQVPLNTNGEPYSLQSLPGRSDQCLPSSLNANGGACAPRSSSILSLSDIRRRTRMGMGTCQGNFCALRAAGATVEAGQGPEPDPLRIMLDFLEERRHGIRPLLWGRQLREAELERGIYGASLNVDGAQPESCDTPKSDEAVMQPESCGARKPAAGAYEAAIPLSDAGATRSPYSPRPRATDYDIVVVGSGLAGMVAALRAAGRGRKTALVSFGAGTLTIGGGSIDILGYIDGEPVLGDPFAAFGRLAPDHPYALLGAEAAAEAVNFLKDAAASAGLPLLQAGTRERGNAWLPTAAGTLKPVWLTGPGMNPASLRAAKSIAVTGVEGMKDFSPRFVLGGLKRNPFFEGKTLSAVLLPAPFLFPEAGGRDVTMLDLARFLDTPDGRAWLLRVLPGAAGAADTALLPSFLGVGGSAQTHAALEQALGIALVETVCLPPAVTGLRLQNALRRALRRAGAAVFDNVLINGALTDGRRCLELSAEREGQRRAFRAESFVIATGGIFGKGITTAPGKAFESIFTIPVPAPEKQEMWSDARFFGRARHRFASMGVAVNRDLQAVDAAGAPLLFNVFFAGRTLGGYDFAAEKSGSGVALATGWFAGGRA
ncbi:MAG: anaerobic glycerol-3-phosphate dehydrogenase subunit B [Desulfovibrio sp.]|jgi:glycerol-3-phosphate dehydrogenase|nr:anaerobic glycerol-3-phosphate dehydrogenase subunit B [Desulfovibrio sp.]